MNTNYPYNLILATLVSLCWFLAAIGVAWDICIARRWRSLWWVPLTLLFGPFAAGAFVLFWGRRERHRVLNAEHEVLQSDIVTRPHSQHEADVDLPTVAAGSGIFLLVRSGAMQDAYRSSQIPFARPLVVRRAASTEERSRPGELLLHDRAVSRTQHCRLQCAGETIVLEDTSTNGTFVDDLQFVHTSTTVRVGSTIQIGTTELLLCDERQVFPTAINR